MNVQLKYDVLSPRLSAEKQDKKEYKKFDLIKGF